MVFIPNIATNHAITYTNRITPGNREKNQYLCTSGSIKSKENNDPPVMTFREKKTLLKIYVTFSHAIFSVKLVTKKPALP